MARQCQVRVCAHVGWGVWGRMYPLQKLEDFRIFILNSWIRAILWILKILVIINVHISVKTVPFFLLLSLFPFLFPFPFFINFPFLFRFPFSLFLPVFFLSFLSFPLSLFFLSFHPFFPFLIFLSPSQFLVCCGGSLPSAPCPPIGYAPIPIYKPSSWYTGERLLRIAA